MDYYQNSCIDGIDQLRFEKQYLGQTLVRLPKVEHYIGPLGKLPRFRSKKNVFNPKTAGS